MRNSPIATSEPAEPRQRFADPYSPIYRPTVVDFFCILIGFTITLILSDWSGLRAIATETTPELVKTNLLGLLSAALLLPVGILLFWPLFFFTQAVRGRTERITSGELLWGLAWLAVLPVTAWITWQRWGTPPE
jgi:hypothetical protein